MASASKFAQTQWRYSLPVVGVVLVTAAFTPFHTSLSHTTVALVLLLVVLFAATFAGRNPALVAALAAMLCFNYFFLPPVYTWTIADSQNLVAWGAFTITAIITGELSGYARRRAREAERLYQELQAAFAQASQAEALRQSEQLKSALLDAVTHDLRTPLTSIKASVTMLLPAVGSDVAPLADDPEGQRELLQVINEETDRLNHFIEGIVELARIEAGALHLRRGWSVVEEIVNEALARAQRHLAAHVVEVNLEPLLPVVRVDARALAEVVFTLLDNAAKYAPQGSRVRVTARRVLGETVEISVIDQGPGVPESLRGRIFDKFYRAASEEVIHQSQPPGGLGLGLSIARGIVAAHGGSISVSSGPSGRGACFAFTVPIGEEKAKNHRDENHRDTAASREAN